MLYLKSADNGKTQVDKYVAVINSTGTGAGSVSGKLTIPPVSNEEIPGRIRTATFSTPSFFELCFTDICSITARKTTSSCLKAAEVPKFWTEFEL